MRNARQELNAALAAAMASATPGRDTVEAGARAYLEFVQNRGARWDILFGGGVAVAGPLAEEVRDMRFETVALSAQRTRRDAPHVSPEAADAYAHLTSGAAEQLARWWRRNPDVPLEDVLEYQMRFIWDGLERILKDAT